MTTIGRIEPFEEQEGTWDQYQERLEQYFIANDVADDKRVPVTLSLIGGKTYALLRGEDIRPVKEPLCAHQTVPEDFRSTLYAHV